MIFEGARDTDLDDSPPRPLLYARSMVRLALAGVVVAIAAWIACLYVLL